MNSKIFVCQSRDCGKESCRLCKEENHIPFKRGEVEKKSTSSANIKDALHCTWDDAEAAKAALEDFGRSPCPSLLKSTA